ncbi:hypothetical protein [Paenibacillus sp.]|uniref:hypothetical protein n=1 Tax=Paenibacillus sp. TaxID=58172 RepID=UPI002810F36C|nr:hypothetical protein [Paenibacillus sp.]
MQKLSNQALLDAYHYIAKGERAFHEEFISAVCKELASRGILFQGNAEAAKEGIRNVMCPTQGIQFNAG